MHNSPFRISIAMASYNGARFIAEQLDSFARQTRLPDELVVTDDCSNDGTPELIDEFAKRAPFPVHLHRNSKTLGVARNFGKALELCSGDLVFLSDQDDVWLVDKLACVEKHFRDNADIQVAINDAFLATASLEISQHTQRDNIRRTGGSDKLFITGCCSAHRKSWQELVLPIPRPMIFGSTALPSNLAAASSFQRLSSSFVDTATIRRTGSSAILPESPFGAQFNTRGSLMRGPGGRHRPHC